MAEKFCKTCQTETERYKDAKCKPCVKARAKAWSAANLEKKAATGKAYREKDPVAHAKKKAVYHAANKAARNAASAAYCKANPEKKKAADAAFRLADSIKNPGRVKAYNDAYRANNLGKLKAASKVRRAKNADALKVIKAEYYAANKEKISAASAARYAADPSAHVIGRHRRRAREAAVSEGRLERGLFRRLFEEQGGKCTYCQCELSAVKPRSPIDHIIAITKGGANSPENMQILCVTCNQQKYNKLPIQFMLQKGYEWLIRTQ